MEFRDVSFHYPSSDKNVLEHISFTARRGETVAFIGATGSGKTTLVSLAARFYDATEWMCGTTPLTPCMTGWAI